MAILLVLRTWDMAADMLLPSSASFVIGTLSGAAELTSVLVGFTGFIEFTALLWWGVELWRTMNAARTNRPNLLIAPFPVGSR